MCDHHDPLDDDLDAIFGALGEGVDPVAATNFATAALSNAVRYEEKCFKCRGSGRFVGYTGRVLGPCYTCKGTGTLCYKTSSEERAANRAKAAKKRETKAQQAMAKAQAWLETNPAEAEWLQRPVTGDFTFHAAMLETLLQWGYFTEKQEAAVRNGTAKFNAVVQRQQEAKAIREAGAATVDITAIRVGFANAVRHLKRPKLRVADIQFSLAPATGRNAGSIYVVRASNDTYLGKITEDNRFITSRECDAATEAEVIRVATDPKAAAEAHGHEYGYCSCCGRELTNPESVARGIGPICAERWGW